MPERISQQIERLLIYIWGIVLPWHTVWIYRSAFINGSVWQYATLGWYVGEALLWLLSIVVIFNFRSAVQSTNTKNSLSGKRLLLLLLFLAFPLYSLVSILWSSDLDLSLRVALFVIEGYLFFTAVTVSRTPMVHWIRAFLVGSLAPIALGLFQWFSQSTFSSTLLGLSEHITSHPGTSIIASDTIGRWLRAYGSFPHPNVFGGYLVFILGLTFVFVLKTTRLRDWIFSMIVHVCAVFTLFSTFSRSGGIAYFFVCIGFFIYSFKHRMREIVILLFATFFISLVFGMLYHDLIYTRTIATSLSETRSIAERADLVSVAWKLHLIHPMMGYGGGTFTRAWHFLDNTLPGYAYQPVHVVLFVMLVEYGCVGVLLFILSFCSLVFFAIRQSSTNRVLFLVSGVLPFVIISFFDHYLITSYSGILIFFAYLSIFFRLSTDSPQSVPKI